MKDYFKILGVEPNANEDEIRSAYKKLAMKHHPDRGGDQAVFQDVQEAYSTLTDPQKRAQWDQQRHFQQHGNQNGFHFQFNFGGGDPFQDILRQFHGHGAPFGFQRPQQNRDLRTTISLDLASTLEAQVKYVDIRNADGSTKTVQVNVPRGVQTNMQMRFGGHGETRYSNLPPGDLYVDFRVEAHPDFAVNGINLHSKLNINAIDAITGVQSSVKGLDGKSFAVNIPSGTQHGTQLRLAGQGLWDINVPRRGDLMVEVTVEVPKVVTLEQVDRLLNLATKGS